MLNVITFSKGEQSKNIAWYEVNFSSKLLTNNNAIVLIPMRNMLDSCI